MADITIQNQLLLKKDKIDYISRPNQFTASVTGTANGPTPGVITVTNAGADIDLSELTTPGVYRIMNLDSTNRVELGIWDGATFYPLHEILAGETYVNRFSRNLTEEYGTGTSTSGAAVNTVRLKTVVAATTVKVLVEAFEA